MIDTYNIEMKGLGDVYQELQSTAESAFDAGYYAEVFYNLADGTVWGVPHVDLARESRTIYEDEEIIKVADFCGRVEKQEIADRIAEAAELHNEK